jgi:hypothetical protein
MAGSLQVNKSFRSTSRAQVLRYQVRRLAKWTLKIVYICSSYILTHQLIHSFLLQPAGQADGYDEKRW